MQAQSACSWSQLEADGFEAAIAPLGQVDPIPAFLQGVPHWFAAGCGVPAFLARRGGLTQPTGCPSRFPILMAIFSTPPTIARQ